MHVLTKIGTLGVAVAVGWQAYGALHEAPQTKTADSVETMVHPGALRSPTPEEKKQFKAIHGLELVALGRAVWDGEKAFKCGPQAKLALRASFSNGNAICQYYAAGDDQPDLRSVSAKNINLVLDIGTGGYVYGYRCGESATTVRTFFEGGDGFVECPTEAR